MSLVFLPLLPHGQSEHYQSSQIVPIRVRPRDGRAVVQASADSIHCGPGASIKLDGMAYFYAIDLSPRRMFTERIWSKVTGKVHVDLGGAMRFTLTVLVIVALSGASGSACGLSEATAQPQNPEPAIQGVWLLNYELSDDPSSQFEGMDRERMRGRGRAGDRGGGRGRGGVGGARSGGRRPEHGMPSPEEATRMRQGIQDAMRDLMTAPRRMTIVATEGEVVATYGDGRVIRLIPDDREHRGIAGTSMQVTRKTRWENAKLVTDIQLETRVEIRLEQTYEVRFQGEEGEQLIVTSRFTIGRFGDDVVRELRRVYDVESL